MKKILCVITLMVLLITGCGKNGGNSDSNNQASFTISGTEITPGEDFAEAYKTLGEPDKYTEAASYLNKNITANNAENTTVLLGDVFEGDGNAQKYNLVVSNPPYIPESEKELMSPETKFEPETALMAGDAGMEF